MGTNEPDDVCDTPIRTVLALGQLERAEMRSLAGWLKTHVGPEHRWIAAIGIEIGIRSAAEFPDLIVVFQSGPDEFSRQEVNQLLAYAPLARLVVCYGAWCESDGRNHTIWPPAVRVPVWGARSRIEREWRSIQFPGDERPLPWSASREEVFAADHPPMTNFLPLQRILIDSPDPAYRAFVVEQLGWAGQSVVSERPTVVLFDVDPWGAIREAALQSLIESYPQAIVVALANLVQPALCHELNRSQVQSVLPKLGLSWHEVLTARPQPMVS